MPPFLPRKRPSPPAPTRHTPAKRARLGDALDASSDRNAPSLARKKTFSVDGDDSSSDSSLSDVDSTQFEDIAVGAASEMNKNGGEIEDSDDEVTIWENTETSVPLDQPTSRIPMMNGPIQITLRRDDEDVIDYGTASKANSGKKGPSKKEKQIRTVTHQLHVQFLLWHNAVRNNWIGDKQVQSILVRQLPSQILREVEKWKRASGITESKTCESEKLRGKKSRTTKEGSERTQRDWGQPSSRLEAGKPNLSHGDPLIVLMKVLSAYWKKRFAITAPGLRKRGYGTKYGLKQDITSYRKDEHDPERHGERIQTLADFRKIAEKAQGSRDVGAQLFTALLRGLDIEARLVASLQPSGYGWTKVEQMIARKPPQRRQEDDSSEDDQSIGENLSNSKPQTNQKSKPRSVKHTLKVISLDTDDESDLKGKLSAEEEVIEIRDDDSLIDVTPSMPKQRRPKYDRDLTFPIYWTEAVSPITHKILPVSPLVLESPVVTTPEGLLRFEPRGTKAEKGRQVMAYVVAYSPDGSAKDVTVRYLRKNIWPGKTKGFRLPLEKIPIYDRSGRIKRYEERDWFKRVIGPYLRLDSKRTEVDDIEDASDLTPQQPDKRNEEGVDTLQSLKASADFVLQRFLRREEALRPDAKQVRTFTSGKGDNYKEEPIYRRADVERCLSAESWHKEGRRPKLGEAPMKYVPVRAVTLTRKREAEEHERQHGEKQTQGLYSWDQTEWIVPPPIQNGIIPKNAYGNMDCFVPSMVPDGAVHIPLKGTLRICKKLDIDFAEAVTGFEFGNKRAVPVCTGVVVAKENENLVKDAWKEWNAEQKRKQDLKLEKTVLDLWRKFVLGLRIREKVQDMYGEEIGVFQDLQTGQPKQKAIYIHDDDDHQESGGFMNEDEEMSGGFLLPHEEETAPVEDLIMEEQSTQRDVHYPTPSSLVTGALKPALNGEGYPDVGSDQSHLEYTNDQSGSASTADSPAPSTTIASELNTSDTGARSPHADTGTALSYDELEEGDSDEEEIYNPRSTRTRLAKSSTKTSLSTRTLDETITSSRRRPGAIKKTAIPKAEARGTGRGIAKPGRGQSLSIPAGSTSKRSRRLLRKESTVITSPYFE